MSHGYLHTMLDMLTGAYNRDDVRNAYSSLPLETNTMAKAVDRRVT